MHISGEMDILCSVVAGSEFYGPMNDNERFRMVCI